MIQVKICEIEKSIFKIDNRKRNENDEELLCCIIYNKIKGWIIEPS